MIIPAIYRFQLIALSGLPGKVNIIDFYSRISIKQLLYTFSFESYLYDLYFDYFQTTPTMVDLSTNRFSSLNA